MDDSQKNLWQRIRSNYWLSLLLDASVLVLVFIGINIWQARDLLPSNTTNLAPPFSLPDRNGKIINLDDYRGQRVVVYFFAPWCRVCALSIHNVVGIAASRDPELVILVVGVDYQQADEIWSFVDKHDLDMPVLLGGNQQMRDWQIKAFPTYYVLNEVGKISSRSVGYSTEVGIRWRSRKQ